jgi:hypothetical protein
MSNRIQSRDRKRPMKADVKDKFLSPRDGE